MSKMSISLLALCATTSCQSQQLSGGSMNTSDTKPKRTLMVQNPFGSSDVSGDEELSFEEYQNSYASVSNPSAADDASIAQAEFDKVDTDKSGGISKEEYKIATENLAGSDANGDSVLSKEEFNNLMKTTIRFEYVDDAQ